MDDLLKEAIADAKAVRETALENAKVALEEAFTPRLKSMLSKKIQSEIEDGSTEDEVTEQDEEVEEEVQDEGVYEDDEDPSDEYSDEYSEEEAEEEEAPEEEMPEDGMEEEGVIEINGVKYAPVVSEEEDEEGEEFAPEDDEEVEDDMGEGEDLDLEAVLRELESELEEDEDADFTEESDESVEEAEEADEDKDEVDEEVDKSSGIGKSDNHKGESDETSKIGVPGKAKHESVEITEGDDDPDVEEVEEEIDLEEVLRALQEEDEEDTTSEDMENLQTELDEHRDVVKYLRSKLNEVNLLNAKLLFTNKLFRSYGLSNDQKMKVVETFDRAKNLREVKLVYATMAESFVNGSIREEIVKESKKGSASKPVASTKSEKQEQEIITESDVMKQRFKKLANIL